MADKTEKMNGANPLEDAELQQVVGGKDYSYYDMQINKIRREQLDRWDARYGERHPLCPPPDADLMQKLGMLPAEIVDDPDLTVDQKNRLLEYAQQIEQMFNPLRRR